MPVESEEPGSPKREPPARRVIVTGIDIPFGQLIVFMLKCALAAIPALLLLSAGAQLVVDVATRVSR
ncbi:MAG: hypothetical protein H3C62_08255 [Gemmatimonadaceae bacterium]|nr:hypothetical protein [Gemmatimonadaceae bacterium]